MENKIDGQGKTLCQVFEDRYVIDYFQREYKWERKHIEQLLFDLDFAFFESYKEGDCIDEVSEYKPYFMGPYIVSRRSTMYSLIDGQQRLTSLTLLLIYIIKHFPFMRSDLEALVYKCRFKKESYNLNIEGRERVMDYLFKNKDFDFSDMSISESNIINRYGDIEDLFPERLNNDDVIMKFSYWLLNKVIFVQILSYSDDNAYTIFETMNDRGANLTSSEMLKSLLLSKVKNADVRRECDKKWKENIQKLVSVDKECELDFFRAWLRGRYLSNVKDTTDIDAIGIGFHRWVKNNLRLFKLTTDSRIERFISTEMSFYISIFLSVRISEKSQDGLYSDIFIQTPYGIASSLAYPLYLSVVNQSDLQTEITEKIKLIAKALDCLMVRRILTHQPVSQSSIRGFMYPLILSVRGLSYNQLKDVLFSFLDKYADGERLIEPTLAARYPYKFLRYFQYRINLHLSYLLGIEAIWGYSDCRRAYLLDMNTISEVRAGDYRSKEYYLCDLAAYIDNGIFENMCRYKAILEDIKGKNAISVLQKLDILKDVMENNSKEECFKILFKALVRDIWHI